MNLKINELITLKLLMFASILVLSGACVEEGEDEISGKGTSRFRLESEGFSVVTFTPGSIETKTLVTIFRDAVSTDDMNKSVTVRLALDPTVLDVYNEENETSYVLLDPAVYDLSVPEGEITFSAGVSAKPIRITLNTGLLDLSQQYALPLVIKEATGGYAVSERLSALVVQTLPINQYDGIYEVTGDPWTDQVNSAITDYYPFEWYAETTGENSIVFWDPYFETYYHPINSGGDRSAYGSFGVEITIDPATGDITEMISPWAPAANTRDLTWDPNVGINKWNSSDGSIDMTYNMIQPSLVPTPPNIRVSFNEHLEYVGPR